MDAAGLRACGALFSFDDPPFLPVPGEHNRINAALAAAAAIAAGCGRDAFGAGWNIFAPFLSDWNGLPSSRGAASYNDSAATTPE